MCSPLSHTLTPKYNTIHCYCSVTVIHRARVRSSYIADFYLLKNKQDCGEYHVFGGRGSTYSVSTTAGGWGVSVVPEQRQWRASGPRRRAPRVVTKPATKDVVTVMFHVERSVSERTTQCYTVYSVVYGV